MHRQQILEKADLEEKLTAVFKPDFKQERDPDLMLYSGGFFDNHDKALFSQIRQQIPEELGRQHFDFNDQRLPEMLFRYRCRNYPDLLTEVESQQWRSYCRTKLLAEQADGKSRLLQANETISEKMNDANPQQELLLEQLSQYISSLCEELGIQPE